MITRRVFCSLPAAAALADAAEAKWEDRLGVLCQLGTTEAVARKVLDAAREAGFRRIKVNFAWDRLEGGFLKGLPGWVRAAGLQCEALGAYVNCVSPGTVLMSTRSSDFEQAIGYAAELGCRRVVAWTGSYLSDLMKADPRNFTRESEDALVGFIEGHLQRLERSRVELGLETYVTLTCPDAISLRRVLDRLPRSVGAVLDPPNMTPPARYAERDAVLREMMRVLEGRITLVHLKDFRIKEDGSYALPGPMQGELNYRLFGEEIKKLPVETPVLAEHIGPAEFRGTREKLVELFGRS